MNQDPDLATDTDPSGPLSPGGQIIAWAVFGGLVLVGFFFGIVTGYERPRPVVVARANKESPRAAESPTTKTTPQPQPAPIVTSPKPPMEEEPTPPKVETPKPTPPKEQPKPKVAVPKKVEPKPQQLTPVSFQREVLPILRTHCLNCHGAGTGKPKGDVNLTSIPNMMKSRGGKILVPGKPDESDVYTSITEREMPDGGRPKPTQKELTTLRNWILTGAKPRRRSLKKRTP